MEDEVVMITTVMHVKHGTITQAMKQTKANTTLRCLKNLLFNFMKYLYQ